MSKLPPSTQGTRRALATFDAASIAETQQFVAALATKGQALSGGSVVTVAPRIAKQFWAAGRNDSAFAWNRAQMTFTQGRALVPRASVKAAANAVVGEARFKIADAALRLQQGTLDVAAWAAEHDRYVKILNGANSALARGGFDEMTPRAWSSASDKVATQFGYSRAFAEDVARGRYGAVGSEMSGGVVSRATMYSDSGRSTYENTLTEVHQENGFELARRVLGAADNCPDCIDWASDEWRPIDEVEEIGSSVCRCITTPHSRVLTRRGLVPIAEVKVGDEVWTHLQRWKAVEATYVQRALSRHRQAWIQAPNGEVVGCTTDHKFLTPIGWQPLNRIVNHSLPLYTMTHETMYSMQQENEVRQDWRCLQNVREGLRVRKEKGLSSHALRRVCKSSFRTGAMGESRTAPNHFAGNCVSTKGVAPEIQRLNSRIIYQRKVGRSETFPLLGRRWAQASCLPLPLGLGAGQRCNLGAHGSASQERRPNGRQDGESRITDGYAAPQASRGNAAIARVGMFGLSKQVQGVAARQAQAASILLTGLLVQEKLYDISVKDDHSFVIEGMVTHNSNCNCIIIYSKTGDENA